MKEFTLEELSKYTGQDGDGPVYVALRGMVYDVSPAREFYGAGGPYELFAGKEVSRALGLMKIDVSECNDNLADLTDKQLTTLQDWVQKFHQKYKVVGKVKGSRAAAPRKGASTAAAAAASRPGSSLLAGGVPLTALAVLWVSVLAFAWYQHSSSGSSSNAVNA